MTNEFNDARKEFTIREMYPVRPWLNYSRIDNNVLPVFESGTHEVKCVIS